MKRGPIRVIRIREVGENQAELLERFATEIYHSAFHEQHREPAEAWMQRLRDRSGTPRQHAALALSEENVIGGCLSETYPGNITLLTYIAVHPSWRGHGVGSALMREALQHHAGSAVFAEVADPDRTDPADRGEALRRLRFFRPWGWRAVGSAYFQPPLTEDGRWAEDLILIHHSWEVERIPAENVRALTSALRGSLDAGPEPDGLRHRYQHATTGDIPTFDLHSLQKGFAG